MQLRLTHVLLLVLIGEHAKAGVGCRGMADEPVDWFIVYKPPAVARDASKFYYADATRTNWTLSNFPIHASTVAVGATLRAFYENDQGRFSFAYNDESPTGAVDSYRGHSKGVVVFDAETGFWMIHSVPNFPPLGSYSYPSTGLKFGQTFLCLTLPARFLGDVGEHLRYVQATPFSYNLPEQFRVRFPVLKNIIKKQSLPKSATQFTRVSQLSTVRGVQLRSFAKHKKFRRDLWSDLIAPELRTSMAVESWLNGAADDLDSICTKSISIYDVSAVTLPDVSFNSSRDHSKWAVASTDSRTYVACVGDLNRQRSQLRRGGGAVCFEHYGLWKTLHTTVKSVQPCVSKTNPSYINYVLFSILCVVLSVLWSTTT